MIVREMQLTYNTKVKLRELSILSSSSEITNYIQKIDWPDKQIIESMYAIYFTKSFRCLGYKLISKGGMDSTLCDSRIILTTALLCGGLNIVLTHNHPSGNVNPSKTDIELTHKCYQQLKSLDLRLIDHIIISEDSYYSFADNGILF